MARMNIAQLTEHIERLKTEAGHVEKRIEHLSALHEPREEQITQLKAQRDRLAKLVELAVAKLAEKNERKQQWELSGGRSAPGGGGRPDAGRGYGNSRGYGRRW